MHPSREQAEFSFDSKGLNSAGADGLASWREIRVRELRDLARSVGLPIGHPAEVWLKGGIRLRGKLELYENHLLVSGVNSSELRLEIQGVSFGLNEMDSCTRAD
jgi:hypothetical protein